MLDLGSIEDINDMHSDRNCLNLPHLDSNNKLNREPTTMCPILSHDS